jgi:hypothetical protein
MPRTDHSTTIASIREQAETLPEGTVERLAALTAADLLELHDDTGISLDSWVSARELVEHFAGHVIVENHC